LQPYEQAHIIAAISFELSHCDDEVVYKNYIDILNNIDFELAKQVATNVGGVVPDKPARLNDGRKSTNLSQVSFVSKTPTIKSRRIAILVADGFSLAQVEGLRAVIKAGGATSWIIGPRRGQVYPEGQSVGTGLGIAADHHYEGQRSTMFDALIIPGGAAHVQKLAQNGRTIHWVREAFGHCKAIGAIGEGVAFLKEAVVLPGIAFTENINSNQVTSSYGVVTTGTIDVGTVTADTLMTGQGFVSKFTTEVSKHRCYERETEGLTTKVAY